MTLLLTGASGHVGREIARRAGCPVLALSRTAIREDSATGGVTWATCELTDIAALRRLAEAHGVDACIHCAAVSNEAYARPEPLAAVVANVLATATLLEAARLDGWRRFLMAGTGSVFQAESDPMRPLREDHPTSARNVYATTKRAAEMLIALYRSQYGLSAASVRISWVYGPPIIADQPTRGPIPAYLGRALRGEAIREGGADFAASFTHVEDVADGLLATLRATELRHDVYHLGHGVNFTAGEVADAVRRAVPGAVIELGGGTEPWTRYTTMRGPLAGDRLLHDTGFRPRLCLEAGIAHYAEWMRGALAVKRAP